MAARQALGGGIVKKFAGFLKKYGTWILLAVNITVITYIIMSDPDFREGFQTLETLSLGFVSLCFVVFSLTFVSEGLQFYFILRMLGARLSLLRSIRAVIIERYYSAITPTNIGGQPALIVYLMSKGLSGPVSASAMSIRFILYQMTLSVFLVLMFIGMPLLKLSISPIILTTLIIGAVGSLAIPLLMVLVSIWPSLTHRLLRRLCRFLGKIRIVKDDLAAYEKVVEMLSRYGQSLRMIDLKFALLVLAFACVQFISAMSVPFFVCFACGVEINYVQSVAYTTVLYTSVNYMPTPGASGVAEGVFFSLFRGIIPGTFIMVAMLLWRISSYYLTIFYGIIESGIGAVESYIKRRRKIKVLE